jgi:prepilin-type N-terminal cleavage/methylation domain-containing protein
MSRGGFTLLEVVVSLTIAAVVVVGAHSGIAMLIDLSQRAARHREDASRAAAVRGTLAEWLRGAYVDTAGAAIGFRGIPGVSPFGSSDHRLDFQTRVPGAAGGGGIQTFHITIRVDRAGAARDGRLIAELRPVAGPGAPRAQGAPAGPVRDESRSMVLAPQVSGFSAQYLLAVGDERHWLSRWESGTRVPDAVRLRIHGDSVPDLLNVPLTVPLVTGG